MGIEVEQLTKIYGSQKAVDHISFRIGAGEIVGFLGPNGAGKSTTMKILTCYMPPSSGKALLNGFDTREQSLEVRKIVGYLPEHNPLYLDMYVHEYLRFVAELYQLPRRQIKKRVSEIVELTGLGLEQHKQIGALSKGYRQRVGLAQALIHDPKILILDEPTSGLDPNQIVEIRNLIKEIGKEKTILFSTHILSEVEAIAGRVIIINRGHIVADENMQKLRNVQEEIILQVEFELAGFNFAPLQAQEGFVNCLELGNNRFHIVSTISTDLRRALFEESVRQQNPIFSLAKKEKSLEDIFRSLTQKSA